MSNKDLVGAARDITCIVLGITTVGITLPDSRVYLHTWAPLNL